MERKEISENKEDLNTLCATVRQLNCKQDYQQCEELICSAMGKYPHAPEPHNLIGLMLENKGEHQKAMKHFRAAWALDPTYIPARQNLECYGTFFSSGKCAYDESDCHMENKYSDQNNSMFEYDKHGIGRIRWEGLNMEMLMDKKANEDYTIVIGCGRLGANLANTLSDEGRNVLIIDKNKDAFRKLSPSFGGLSINGDATDLDVLQEAQIGKANIVVAVTNSDNANIMVAQIARELFQVKHVIARLYDPDRECIYREFRIDTICPAVLSAKEIGKILAEVNLSKAVLQEGKR